MRTLVKLIFGSHLYGTTTSDSDTDFKGVFMPSARDICLGRIPKAVTDEAVVDKDEHGKNTANAVDSELFSLHYFLLTLAAGGQTVAFDMLHADARYWVVYDGLWKEVYENRSRFYAKSLTAFLGYARRQAAKYGIKGSRLAEAKEVMRWLGRKTNDTRLGDILGEAPLGEHVRLLEATERSQNQPGLEVCGRRFYGRTRLEHVKPSLTRFVWEARQRALAAERNEGVDWKAVSHALRAALQLRELYTTGDIKFPLRERHLLIRVKTGTLHYKNVVAPFLEDVIEEVEELAANSNFPDYPDLEWCEDLLISVSKKEVFA